jgi:hypothetical protein
MSAASSEGTLTAARPRSDASTAPTSRPSLFVAVVWLVLVVEFSWAIAGVALAIAGVF